MRSVHLGLAAAVAAFLSLGAILYVVSSTTSDVHVEAESADSFLSPLAAASELHDYDDDQGYSMRVEEEEDNESDGSGSDEGGGGSDEGGDDTTTAPVAAPGKGKGKGIPGPNGYFYPEYPPWYNRTGPSDFQPQFGLLGEPWIGFALSLALMLVANSVLYTKENFTAQVMRLYGHLGATKSFTEEDDVDDECDNCPVHLSGVLMKGVEPVVDEIFGVSLANGACRLRRTVEVYRHCTTVEKVWSDTWVSRKNASIDSTLRQNIKPDGLTIGSTYIQSPCVYLGEDACWKIMDDMLETFDEFVPATHLIKDKVLHANVAGGQLEFEKGRGEWWYWSGRHGDSTGAEKKPQIGDVRVKFEVVPSCKVTVLGLQIRRDVIEVFRVRVGVPVHTILPYRLTRARCCCGDTESVRRQDLLSAALKDKAELSRENECTEPCYSLCLPCVTASRFFERVVRLTGVYRLAKGEEKLSESIKAVQVNTSIAWILLRILTLAMNVFGAILFVNQTLYNLQYRNPTRQLFPWLPRQERAQIIILGALLGVAMQGAVVITAHSFYSNIWTAIYIVSYTILLLLTFFIGNAHYGFWDDLLDGTLRGDS